MLGERRDVKRGHERDEFWTHGGMGGRPAIYLRQLG